VYLPAQLQAGCQRAHTGLPLGGTHPTALRRARCCSALLLRWSACSLSLLVLSCRPPAAGAAAAAAAQRLLLLQARHLLPTVSVSGQCQRPNGNGQCQRSDGGGLCGRVLRFCAHNEALLDSTEVTA
jgi:hypothetical protein